MTRVRTEFDTILIVGAGPVGLSLALELMRLGHTPRIIDKGERGANTSRAAVVHARTLEVLEPLGLSSEIVAAGVVVPSFRIRDRDRILLDVDFSAIPSTYPYTLMCPQNITEQLLLNRLSKHGCVVERACEALSLIDLSAHAVPRRSA